MATTRFFQKIVLVNGHPPFVNKQEKINLFMSRIWMLTSYKLRNKTNNLREIKDIIMISSKKP